MCEERGKGLTARGFIEVGVVDESMEIETVIVRSRKKRPYQPNRRTRIILMHSFLLLSRFVCGREPDGNCFFSFPSFSFGFRGMEGEVIIDDDWIKYFPFSDAPEGARVPKLNRNIISAMVKDGGMVMK